MNFRIMRHKDGTLSFVDPPGQTQEMEEKEEFATLEELIKWHLHNKVCVMGGRGGGGREGGGGGERRGRGGGGEEEGKKWSVPSERMGG